MSGEKSISDLIKNRVERGDSREKIVGDLILEGYNYREIEATLQRMKRENKLPESFWTEEWKGKSRAAIPWGKYKRIREEVGAGAEPVSSGRFFNFIRLHKLWFFVFLGIVLGAVVWFLLWYFLYWQSSLSIFQRSFRNLAAINSLSFESSAAVRVGNISFGEDKYLATLLEGTDQNSILKINLLGSVDLKDANVSKRAFSSTATLDGHEWEIWRVGLIQISPDGFYLNTGHYLNEAANQLEPLSGFPWVDLGRTGPSDITSLFLPQVFLKSNLLFYSLNLNSVSNLKNNFSNRVFSREDFIEIEKLPSENGFYHLWILPREELADSIFSLLEPLVTTGSWLEKKDLLKARWEIWIGKEDLLPHQVGLYLTDSPEPVVQFVLRDFNYPFDISEPSPTILPQDVLKIINASEQDL